MAVHRTLKGFRKALPAERKEQHRQGIIARLGFDPKAERHRLIALGQVTTLARVKPDTGTQWRMRSKRGELRRPFPEPAPGSFARKPLYDPMEIAAWLDWTNRWEAAQAPAEPADAA